MCTPAYRLHQPTGPKQEISLESERRRKKAPEVFKILANDRQAAKSACAHTTEKRKSLAVFPVPKVIHHSFEEGVWKEV